MQHDIILCTSGVDGCIHDSCDYNILRRNTALRGHLCATGVISDLIDMIIEYSQPAPDMLHRIAQYNRKMSDPIFFGTEQQYISEIFIEYKQQYGHRCNDCYSPNDHMCFHWEMVNYDDGELVMRICTDDICWADIFLILYTGDVRILMPTMVTDDYLEDEFSEGLSEGQHEILRGVRIEIAMNAAQTFIDSLIW